MPLAVPEDLLEFDLAPSDAALAEAQLADACAICGAEPLAASASYAETLAWLERNAPGEADRIRSVAAEELDDMTRGGRSAGDPDGSIDWRGTRKTRSFDSLVSASYALPSELLQRFFRGLSEPEREFFVENFVVATCGICAVRRFDGSEIAPTLLRNYVNAHAGGSEEVARRQLFWPTVESIVSVAASTARSLQSAG